MRADSMAITHHIRENYAEIIIIGKFSQERLFIELERALSGDRDVATQKLLPDTHLLINVTQSEEFPPLSAVERIAGIIANSGSGFSGRVAVLVDHSARYGCARQLGAFLAGYDIISEPFYNREEALSWLQSRP